MKKIIIFLFALNCGVIAAAQQALKPINIYDRWLGTSADITINDKHVTTIGPLTPAGETKTFTNYKIGDRIGVTANGIINSVYTEFTISSKGASVKKGIISPGKDITVWVEWFEVFLKTN